MDRDSGELIGNKVGRYMRVDLNEDGTGWGKFLRIRTLIDIRKPLMRGVLVKNGTDQLLVGIKYERLPNFCFHCGCLGHIEKDCDARYRLSQESQKKSSYGVWLKAEPDRKSFQKRSETSEVNDQTMTAGDETGTGKRTGADHVEDRIGKENFGVIQGENQELPATQGKGGTEPLATNTRTPNSPEPVTSAQPILATKSIEHPPTQKTQDPIKPSPSTATLPTGNTPSYEHPKKLQSTSFQSKSLSQSQMPTKPLSPNSELPSILQNKEHIPSCPIFTDQIKTPNHNPSHRNPTSTDIPTLALNPFPASMDIPASPATGVPQSARKVLANGKSWPVNQPSHR
ncbi:hypothetical protein RJ639_013251 [Escallonia herrerae]|uniref:CCHC-type domain-containing protein n=1 Tax=Escallonia herrerae TaxID=1293975 RepID=A0AA89AP87_9ASTE|nr:hypothetical protein RJ639_020073 [Escallonia herrerae]KAK3009208.1 hypothetical protein RJ639_013251 [Escallonia herrerae]